jgi:hypothetical protein
MQVAARDGEIRMPGRDADLCLRGSASQSVADERVLSMMNVERAKASAAKNGQPGFFTVIR